MSRKTKVSCQKCGATEGLEKSDCGCQPLVVPRSLIAQFESKGHSDPKAAATRAASALEACNLSTFQSYKRAGLSDEEARQKAAEKCKSEASKMDLIF